MLEDCKTALEKWSGVHKLIDQWLNQRQRLLVVYCDLAGQNTFDEQNSIQTSRLKKLCELLVDYCSAGHFEIYNQLLSEAKSFNDQDGLAFGQTQMAHIEPTTDTILDFNDKYQETDDLSSLFLDLSDLGVALEARFGVEDQIIEVLHSAHNGN